MELVHPPPITRSQKTGAVLNPQRFNNFCIKLIQWHTSHQSIMSCRDTQSVEYIPGDLRQDFVIKKRFANEMPRLPKSIAIITPHRDGKRFFWLPGT